MKKKKELSDEVIGGIYEYYRTDNDEVVYRGSSEGSLDSLDGFHRKGDTYEIFKNNPSWIYDWSNFRVNLRRPIGKKLKVRWIVEQHEMSREELLRLEGDMIRKKQDEGQCYLNKDNNPLRYWK
jgi:hypothetical protein